MDQLGMESPSNAYIAKHRSWSKRKLKSNPIDLRGHYVSKKFWI